MSRPIFLIFQKLKKGSWKLPRKQTFLFPDNSSIANLNLFVNSFFLRRETLTFFTSCHMLFANSELQTPYFLPVDILANPLIVRNPARFFGFLRTRVRAPTISLIFYRFHWSLRGKIKKKGCAEAQPFFIFVVPVLFFITGSPGKKSSVLKKEPRLFNKRGLKIIKCMLLVKHPRQYQYPLDRYPV